MARSLTAPLWNRTSTRGLTNSKAKGKKRSTIAAELFRRNRPIASAGIRPGHELTRSCPITDKSNHPLSSKLFLNHPFSSFSPNHPTTSRPRKPRVRENEGLGVEHNEANQASHLRRYGVEMADEGATESCSEPCKSDEDEEDWLDGSTLIALYQDEQSETEQERALALVEYLQVPMQEKSQTLKQDLCNALISTINEIRQAQDKVYRGADVDRGKGIVHFNDACDKRHLDASLVHAQVKDSMADNQAEIKNLFIQLRQAYDNRNQLWVDLKARIEEITGQQAVVLDQLDDDMARTIASLEKRCKGILKGDSGKDKEKLLRDVLGNL